MATDRLHEEQAKPARQPAQASRSPQHALFPKLDEAQAPGTLPAPLVRGLQRVAGNQTVQRMLAQRSSEGATTLDDETAAAIERERGSGASLEASIASRAGAVMGAQFDDVAIHANASADTLSRQLGATAFTTGKDIFFRQGTYDPGSSDGQHLIAHELTHVVQQGSAPAPVQGQMAVNDPEDAFEAEADEVADQVLAVQRQEVEEEEELLQMQEEQEEEELLQA
ncbi:MAG: DUF4157 domain-containing protein [Anaerolineae bacterium]|nr:DUF4157 domain-containing protein [Anaerolineae bacterium]